jgi:hypothetical protein
MHAICHYAASDTYADDSCWSGDERDGGDVADPVW